MNNSLQEDQRYGRNKNTLINNTYINSGEYRKKFDFITNNNSVNRILYEKAKKMLKHRSGTLFEDMYWINANDGKIICSALNEQKPEQILYTSAIRKCILAAENIITMHTHPASMPPSISDFNSYYRNGYKLGLVICHNGKIFAYKAYKYINERLATLYVANYIKSGYNEYEAQLKMLNDLKENNLLVFWEVLPNGQNKN